jgi:hypothetical protein
MKTLTTLTTPNSSKDSKPVEGVKVLVFSSTYPVGDSMRFRIIDSQFFGICLEVDSWGYLELGYPVLKK